MITSGKCAVEECYRLYGHVLLAGEAIEQLLHDANIIEMPACTAADAVDRVMG